MRDSDECYLWSEQGHAMGWLEAHGSGKAFPEATFTPCPNSVKSAPHRVLQRVASARFLGQTGGCSEGRGATARGPGHVGICRPIRRHGSHGGGRHGSLYSGGDHRGHTQVSAFMVEARRALFGAILNVRCLQDIPVKCLVAVTRQALGGRIICPLMLTTTFQGSDHSLLTDEKIP